MQQQWAVSKISKPLPRACDAGQGSQSLLDGLPVGFSQSPYTVMTK